MNDTQKRFIGFSICIVIRFILVIIAKIINKIYLPYLGYLALLPALGFMTVYLTGSRKVGIETLGEKIWWNDLRPLHAILYAVFALMAINKCKNAYIILLIDVVIGLIAFINYHYNQGVFNNKNGIFA